MAIFFCDDTVFGEGRGVEGVHMGFFLLFQE